MYLKRTLNRFVLLLTASSFIWLSACKIDEDLAKPTLSPDFILPMVYGELGLKNLVKDTSFIKTDPTGYLKVGYLDTVEVLNSTQLADALKIVQTGFPAPPATLTFTSAGGGNIQFPTDQLLDINLNLGTSMVKKLAFHSASFIIKVQNAHSFPYNGLEIKIPGLVENGVPFTTGPVNIAAGQTFEQTFTVGESTWDLTGRTGLDTSKVLFEFSSAAPIVGPGGGSCLMTMEFVSTEMKYWKGKSSILQQILSTQTSTSSENQIIPKETFKGIKSGSITLKDVDVKLDFQSKLGIPMGMNIQLESTNGVDGSKVALNPLLSVNIQESTIGSNDEPNINSTIQSFGDGASNLADVLTNFPTKLKVTAGIGSTFTNPDPYGYFFHENSNLNLLVDATIPFAISFNELRLESAFDFDLFQKADLDTNTAVIDTAVLTFTITNGFPYDIDIELTARNGALDSLAQIGSFSLSEATTGMVNGELKVIAASKSTSTIALSQAIVDKLKVAKKLGVKARLNTTAASPKIFTDYKLGFDAKARIGVTARPLK